MKVRCEMYKEIAKQQLNELKSELEKFGLFEVKSAEELEEKLEYLYNHCNLLDDYNISQLNPEFADICYNNIEVSLNTSGKGTELCGYINYWADDDYDDEPYEWSIKEIEK